MATLLCRVVGTSKVAKMCTKVPQRFTVTRRTFFVGAEVMEDLDPDPNYNLFDPPEEFAVFNTATKWFEPTVPFSKDGKALLPMDLSPLYATKISAIASSLPKVQEGVVRLMVTFENESSKLRNHYLTTGFTVSPTIIFTDYHCVPPVSFVYNAEGRKVPAARRAIFGLTHPIQCNEQSFAADSPIPLEVVQLQNDRTENVPTIDPVNGLRWNKGARGVDLAVLRISSGCTAQFSSIYTLLLLGLYAEGSPIGYIGYPRLLAPRHLARVMAVIKASGYKFPTFDGVADHDQHTAAEGAIDAALRACFANYNCKVLAPGKVIKVGKHEIAVSNPSTTGTSGSPYISLDDPTLVIGNNLGNGVCVSGEPLENTPNYNILMTVDHPEWAVKYAKYAVPSLPASADDKKVKLYIDKHVELLKKEKLV